MNGGTFLSDLNSVVTGDKFLTEVELSMHAHIRASDDYLPLVTGDAPTWVEAGISFDDGETVLLDVNIPQDYDKSMDLCALRLHEVPAGASAHTTDMGITTAQSIYRAGAAVDATASTAVAEDATASTGALVRENVLDISGRGYQAGDRIRLTLDANNSSTTELILLGIDLIYGSCVAAFSDADRYRSLG